MPEKISDRVTVLETGFKIHLEGIHSDIGEMKGSIESINTQLLPLPEIMKKVNNHHAVFHDHSAVINNLKEHGCPTPKAMPIANGEKNKRKYDDKKYRIMVWALIISIAGLIGANVTTCAWVSKNFNAVIQSMPK